ncbi:MAG: response regulator [Eubacterium sp.]|nr:response regulator [Eubacterium sp.]
MDEKKVLIVDDDVTNLHISESVITSCGAKSYIVPGGKAAIQCFEHLKPFDVIFIDHLMPEMDGVETMKRIRQTEGGDKAVIVAMSANEGDNADEFFLEAGFDGFIEKPIDRERVLFFLED